ncbi:hypothetical protein PTTG_08653 [Puccinia triticina 1-1 BBBD Race 1]|uniref:Uncharacterized protein n=1 Tax=Puccinia triticina (isolate 1-1 / race 1 (BBBD)) TaxID=630390 RepID=A0A180GCD9_PUCT1|nr:hypothetical protein PTTG_08653 [Puccinia triticina 1-1 BBBD Race 1]
MGSKWNNPEEDTPSTPPNNPDIDNPPNLTQSIRRKSSRLRTPSTRPGFIPTQNNSRRALGSNGGPAPAKSKSKTTVIPDLDEEPNQSACNEKVDLGLKQVNRWGKEVHVNTTQDSDEDNQKAVDHSRKTKKNPDQDRDGFDHVRLYFYIPGEETCSQTNLISA